MKTAALLSLLLSLLTFSAAANNAALRQEMAPTGTLRVGLWVGPPVVTVSAATKDPSGTFRGVTVDLGVAVAEKLGVPVTFLSYATVPAIAEAGSRAEWDVSFLAVDAQRATQVDFGTAYASFQSFIVVPPGSLFQANDDIDREGAHIAAVSGSTTYNVLERRLKKAKLIGVPSNAELTELLRTNPPDAGASTSNITSEIVAKFPGFRELPGAIHETGTAVAVPKGRPAALAFATMVVEEAKASGRMSKIFDTYQVPNVVAPAGARY